MKNKAAQELGRLRQKAMTPEERQNVAKLGAMARWANTTPEQRKAYSEKMLQARREKKAGDK